MGTKFLDEDPTRIPTARRNFLKRGGAMVVAISCFGTNSVDVALAAQSTTLGDKEKQTLFAMVRTLYPHKNLPDAAYAIAVQQIEVQMAVEPNSKKIIKSGLARLDRASRGNFAALDTERRHSILLEEAGTPFFEMVRKKCITSLYDNLLAFAFLGYPGSSWEHGGYINRGFQDLDWLPNPPAESSPPPFG